MSDCLQQILTHYVYYFIYCILKRVIYYRYSTRLYTRYIQTRARTHKSRSAGFQYTYNGLFFTRVVNTRLYCSRFSKSLCMRIVMCTARSNKIYTRRFTSFLADFENNNFPSTRRQVHIKYLLSHEHTHARIHVYSCVCVLAVQTCIKPHKRVYERAPSLFDLRRRRHRSGSWTSGAYCARSILHTLLLILLLCILQQVITQQPATGIRHSAVASMLCYCRVYCVYHYYAKREAGSAADRTAQSERWRQGRTREDKCISTTSALNRSRRVHARCCTARIIIIILCGSGGGYPYTITFHRGQVEAGNIVGTDDCFVVKSSAVFRYFRTFQQLRYRYR